MRVIRRWSIFIILTIVVPVLAATPFEKQAQKLLTRHAFFLIPCTQEQAWAVDSQGRTSTTDPISTNRCWVHVKKLNETGNDVTVSGDLTDISYDANRSTLTALSKRKFSATISLPYGDDENRLQYLLQKIILPAPEKLGRVPEHWSYLIGTVFSNEKTKPNTTLQETIFKTDERVSPAVPLFDPDPDFFDDIKPQHDNGPCILSVLVNEEGTVSQTQVQRSLGPDLDKKATETVLLWRFKPAMKSGKPIAARVIVGINFWIQRTSLP